MIEIGYIGFSSSMIKILSESDCFLVTVCICEKKRLSGPYVKLCQDLQLELYVAESKEEICDYLSRGNCNYFIMYEFGIILPKEVFDTGDINVFNFHPGSLLTNRGAHPVVWSVLNDEKYTMMTVYEVTAKVDDGKIISQRVYEIEEDDSVRTLKSKMENGISEQLTSVYHYILNKESENIGGGVMRRKIKKQDYTIDLTTDDLRKIKAKILAQDYYQGAVLSISHAQYYIREIENVRRQYRIAAIKDDRICVERKECFELKLSNDPEGQKSLE